MPEGSSSAAPVITPGPMARKTRYVPLLVLPIQVRCLGDMFRALYGCSIMPDGLSRFACELRKACLREPGVIGSFCLRHRLYWGIHS